MSEQNQTLSLEQQSDTSELDGAFEQTVGEISELHFGIDTDTLPSDPSDISQVRAFMHGRHTQLKKARTGFKGMLDRAFGKEIAGVNISGATWIKSRFNPAQLKMNAQANLGFTERQARSRGGALNNPTLRNEFYRQALDGNTQALEHLEVYDRNFGVAEERYSDELKEVAAIFSGAALVHRVGATALTGILLGKELLEKDPDKREARIKKTNAFVASRSSMFGAKKAEARKSAYKDLAETRDRARSGKRRSPGVDPFDMV